LPTQLQRPVWWRIIVGALLIFVEVKNNIHPAANLLKASTPGEQLVMNFAMATLIAIGCWLVFTGIAPFFRKAR